MKSKKGFTLIELMVVILIVGILAAVAIPLMRGRIDSAKWTEGKSGAGTLGTGLRAYSAEMGGDFSALTFPLAGTGGDAFSPLGIEDDDLDGTIFDVGDYIITSASFNTGQTPNLQFLITITCAGQTLAPTTVTLDHDGVWTP